MDKETTFELGVAHARLIVENTQLKAQLKAERKELVDLLKLIETNMINDPPWLWGKISAAIDKAEEN